MDLIKKRSAGKEIGLTILTFGIYGAFSYKSLVADLNTMSENTFIEQRQEKVRYSHKHMLFGLIAYLILVPILSLFLNILSNHTSSNEFEPYYFLFPIVALFFYTSII